MRRDRSIFRGDLGAWCVGFNLPGGMRKFMADDTGDASIAGTGGVDGATTLDGGLNMDD